MDVNDIDKSLYNPMTINKCFLPNKPQKISLSLLILCFTLQVK